MQSTPVPIGKISTLGLILSVNTMSIYMIFSFLPFMVEFYFPGIDRRDLGRKAGMLGSAFSLGGILGNFIWSYMSDLYGRRFALLGGLVGMSLAVSVFGIAPSFAIAISARFAWGLLNGNIAISKSYLAEILDDTNSIRGTSYYGVVGGIGRTLGPVIGGYLAEPSKLFPDLFPPESFVGSHPFVLPCLFVLSYALLVLVLAYFVLPESKRTVAAPSIDQERGAAKRVTFKNMVTVKSIGSDAVSFQSLNQLDAQHQEKADSLPVKIARVFRRKEVVLVIAIYGIASCFLTMTSEVFPIWVVTKKEDGGFDFTSADIGLASMMSGPFIIVSQIFIYPPVAEHIGVLRMLSFTSLVYGVLAIFIPTIVYFPLASTGSRILLVLTLSLINTLGQWILVTLFALINNSATSATLATVNAVAQSCASLGRAIGPFVGASIFAWTERNQLSWPLNFAFTWNLIGISSLTVAVMGLILPNSLAKSKLDKTREALIVPEQQGLLSEPEGDRELGDQQMELLSRRKNVT